MWNAELVKGCFHSMDAAEDVCIRVWIRDVISRQKPDTKAEEKACWSWEWRYFRSPVDKLDWISGVKYIVYIMKWIRGSRDGSAVISRSGIPSVAPSGPNHRWWRWQSQFLPRVWVTRQGSGFDSQDIQRAINFFFCFFPPYMTFLPLYNTCFFGRNLRMLFEWQWQSTYAHTFLYWWLFNTSVISPSTLNYPSKSSLFLVFHSINCHFSRCLQTCTSCSLLAKPPFNPGLQN